MPSQGKLPVDSGTIADAQALSFELGVTPAAVVQVSLDAQNADPNVRSRAQKTLAAWRTGTAIEWKGLSLPDAVSPCLTLTMGAWQTDPIEAPFTRSGHGVSADWTFNGAAEVAATRGFWRGVVPGQAGSCRIIAFRYGLPVTHVWANELAYEEGRLWARACWVASSDGWRSADDGQLITELDSTDLAVQDALSSLVVYPSPSRNPVSWLVAGRRK